MGSSSLVFSVSIDDPLSAPYSGLLHPPHASEDMMLLYDDLHTDIDQLSDIAWLRGPYDDIDAFRQDPRQEL
jgi:hypothetical protein